MSGRRNFVKKAMDKLCKPSTIPNKKRIKSRQNDVLNELSELDSYSGSSYDDTDETHTENTSEGEEE